MSKIKKVTYYWDSCIFLAWLKNELRPAGEMEGLIEIIGKINKNECNLVTSVMTRAEILRSTLTEEAKQKLSAIMMRTNFKELETTFGIWNLTHDIRDHYKQSNLSNLGLPDAVHLASAIYFEVDTFLTFDNNLLTLNGNVAGHNLVILKPQSENIGLFANAQT